MNPPAPGRGDAGKDPRALVARIREVTEMIRRDPQPKVVGYVCLAAALGALLDMGVPAAKVRAEVERLLQDEARRGARGGTR